MLDYLKYTELKNKEELRKQFIIGYDIVDNENRDNKEIDYTDNSNIQNNNQQLIVYYADGSEHVFDYTKEKEKIILSKMKQQLLDYEEQINEGFENETFTKSKEINYCVAIFLMFGILGMVIFKAPLAIIIFGLITTFGAFLAVLKIIISIMYKVEKNDFQKNNLFLKNEELINKMLNSEKSKNIFSNVNDKIKKASPVKPDGTCEMDINSINNMNLKDMKQLLAAIKRELMFEQSIEENRNEDKVLRK